MTSVAIRAGNHQYEALVGRKLIDTVGLHIGAKIAASTCAIISDSKVAPLFGGRIDKGLKAAGFDPTLLTIPTGEQSKTLEQAESICDQMIAAHLDRRSFVVGLGGGVIGDISGFVAAIFERGIPHIQIPTTLLAMVDSSIGGKTGVNTAAGKNLLGAIHHPLLVIDDVDFLKTLPPREFKQGFAEIIKHAIIANAEMLKEVARLADLSNLQSATDTLPPLIRQNIEIKSSIVAKDEFDRTGERAVLNFGHTVGHAIERAGEFTQFLHGEAISLGMVAACHVSRKRAGLPQEQEQTIINCLQRFDLPTQLEANFPKYEIVKALQFDKKFESGKVSFVVTPGIGSAYLSKDVTLEDIREAIDEL